MAYLTTVRGRSRRVEVRELEAGHFEVQVGDRCYQVDCLEPQPGLFSLLVGGRSLEVDVHPEGDQVALWFNGDHYDVEVVDERRHRLAAKRGAGATGRQDLRSPMPGHVRKVCVSVGDVVEAGDVLLILEAMKMQNELRAPLRGRVVALAAREGVAVASGEPLCVLEPEDA